jgi:transcriptional regulator with XRE-family HTH domain
MKKYTSLGELIKDYREVYGISQADLAIKVGADIRTIQRWEKDETNIKLEKELDFVRATLLPYQLVRNLNAQDSIATYYDFKIRKYSLSTLTNDFPDAYSLKYKLVDATDRIRTIDVDEDLDYIMEYLHLPEGKRRKAYNIISKVITLLPELNLIINDQYGNYSGHSIYLPISLADFNKIKNKEIDINDLEVSDLVNPKSQKIPVFLNYDSTADCNDNIYYLLNRGFQFFKNIENQDYIYCAYNNRYDITEFRKQAGIEVVWTDPAVEGSPIWEAPKKFLVANFNDYFKML